MSIRVFAQAGWKQSLQYDIHVLFNPQEKSLDATEKLLYINHSPDTLTFIWFHVWPNAYRNDKTLYSEQLLENGDTRFYFSAKEQKGYINRLDFRVNGNLAGTEDHPEYLDVIKLLLPRPLIPGDSISVSVSFHLRLPYNFNGNGYSSHHFELRNWYPEPAVLDSKGWHPMPLLMQGGAYHEAANFNVDIEAPSEYLIAAGALADTLENKGPVQKVHFSIKNANAFAWIADNRYKTVTDTLALGNQEPLRLRYFYIWNSPGYYHQVVDAIKTELRTLSAWLIPYPYPSLTIAQAYPMMDQNFSGLVAAGMYSRKSGEKINLEKAVIGQWFETILLSDQRDHAWLSRGFVEFYNRRLEKNLTRSTGKADAGNHDLWLRVAENERTVQPIETITPVFTAANDSLVPENNAALWLRQLADTVGTDRFDKNMVNFLSGWKFNHPYPENFQSAIRQETTKNLQPLFEKLNNNVNLVPASGSRTLKPAFIFSAKNTDRNNYIGLAPLPGYNRYDGFMLGALIHNITLPENKFEFLFTPMYAFGSHRLEGLGRLGYTWHPDKKFSRINIGINGGTFASNRATDSTGKEIYESFAKLVPYIRVDFKPSAPRSSIHIWADFKSYLIWENQYGQYNVSSKDSLIHPNSVSTYFRYVNQLSFNLQDSRSLYPYDLRAEFQQSELFYRINLHANYFFNYPDGGGLQVRFFASKFGAWNGSNSTDLTRYEPKLLGVNGEEDYLYEDYFIGRSASDAIENTSIPNAGLPAQQIMNRDGGLKLRIDAYDYVQGKSENWVSSLNFTTTLPQKLFPFPVPIRVFFDIGTYAEAWETNAPTQHFLYTGGIQLSLFKNVLNIYAPLLYSSDFNDALRSVNFGKKITFSIDIQNINYKKLIRKAAGS